MQPLVNVDYRVGLSQLAVGPILFTETAVMYNSCLVPNCPLLLVEVAEVLINMLHYYVLYHPNLFFLTRNHPLSPLYSFPFPSLPRIRCST